ncbi:MAG: YfiM family protein, partial [Bacteroidetes bacterium]|nr:YfiM family protein [Bacteroidota bacterium]
MKKSLLLLLLCCIGIMLNASDSSSTYQKRQHFVQGAVFAGTPIIYGGLYSLWYADYPMKSFHWTNDSREWRGMDKCGHSFSAFQLSNQTYQWYRWSGFSQRKSAGLSAISALYFQNPLEIFDGFSQGWGASKADLIANASGAMLSSIQLYFWGENKLLLRFSYASSPFAASRPGILGSNAAERLMKDYNG